MPHRHSQSLLPRSTMAQLDAEAEQFHRAIQHNIEAALASGLPVFQTRRPPEGLFPFYLNGFAHTHRQYHNCRACSTFIEHFGGLVTVDPEGHSRSLLWRDGFAKSFPGSYRVATQALAHVAETSPILSPFWTDLGLWGTPESSGWTHMSFVVPKGAKVFHTDAGPHSAARREAFETLSTTLSSFPLPVVTEALRLLQANAFSRSEKFLAPMEFLHALMTATTAERHQRRRQNLIWHAAATAPEGFLHIRSGVLGTLLADLTQGLPLPTVTARFARLTNSTAYQRPTAPPTQGTIDRAEALVESLGIANSLPRRFAGIEEVRWLWRRVEPRARTSIPGVFSSLRPAAASPKAHELAASNLLPTVTMTWAKFVREVLSTAPPDLTLDLLVPQAGPFMALTTAQDLSAPPIIKWDGREETSGFRTGSPVSWYTYPTTRPARLWSLAAGIYVPVLGVTKFPNLWGGDRFAHLFTGAMLALQGAMDTSNTSSALFPEILRQELHEVRSVIEAYSRTHPLGDCPPDFGPVACGLGVSPAQPIGAVLRVKASGGTRQINIDRWD